MNDEPEKGRPFWGQGAGRRLIAPQPVGRVGEQDVESQLLEQLGPDTVMMMGNNPALAPMPEKPRLLDFFRLRFGEIVFRHLLNSAKLALDAGAPDRVVAACLLHDIAMGALIRTDHGYWSAQLIEPYVSEEIAWAVRYHQALRFTPDDSVGYPYPEAYRRYFGDDFQLPDYIRRDAEMARAHKWYMTSRRITLFDVYAFDNKEPIDPEIFTDVIGRNFRQPEEGLGFDGSPVAHMWRTMIWPNNFV